MTDSARSPACAASAASGPSAIAWSGFWPRPHSITATTTVAATTPPITPSTVLDGEMWVMNLRPAEVLADEVGAGVVRPDREDEQQDPATLGAERAQRRAGRHVRGGLAEPDDERQQRDVQRAEDRRHPGLQPLARIGLGERRDGDQHDPDADQQEAAALEELRDRGVEDDDQGQATPSERERGVAGSRSGGGRPRPRRGP